MDYSLNKHLNLFRFFSGSNEEYRENNLSRAFALCLKNDSHFFDAVLKEILDEEDYKRFFNTDNPEHLIEINLQKRLADVDGLEKVYAVSSSGKILSEEKYRETDADGSADPVTDVFIGLGDVCILFEFKKTVTSCAAQLKNQASILIQKDNRDQQDAVFRDFSWKKLISTALTVLSFQKHVGAVNPFLNDFIKYTESEYPNWFPSKPLNNIPFPADNQSPNSHHLRTRLNLLMEKFHPNNADGSGTEERGDRFVIKVNYKWASELHLTHGAVKGDGNCLFLSVYPGDTKSQGFHLFKNRDRFDWPSTILDGYKLIISPYLKFSNYSKGVFWVWLKKDEAQITHKLSFFEEYAGRWKKERWHELEKKLTSIKANWRNEDESKGSISYDDVFINSNRSYYDLSIGMGVSVCIPYKKALTLDSAESVEQDNELVGLLRKIAAEMKRIIDG